MRTRCMPFLLLVALAAFTRPARAALIRTYDLDSLCYMSTDIVEVTLDRQFPAGRPIAQDPLTATVVHSLAGSFHPDDNFTPADMDLYTPLASGQRCFLFLERTEYSPHWWPTPPALLAAPRVVDMLVIDGRGHVRRYFQWGDPGGLRAEGYSPDPMWTMPKNLSPTVIPPGFDTTDEARYPTVAQERTLIAAKWAAANALRPLLSHVPRPQDVNALLALLRTRRSLRAPQDLPSLHRLTDGLALAVCCRIADLRDPAAAMVAIVADGNEEDAFLSGLDDAANSYGARRLLAEPQAPTLRRF